MQPKEFRNVFFGAISELQERPASRAHTMDVSSNRPSKGGKTMGTLLDILRKDSKGSFHWLETANDIDAAITRVLELSSESADEFVVFRGTDLKVVATSRPIRPTAKYSGS